jgi:hypothetical protein
MAVRLRQEQSRPANSPALVVNGNENSFMKTNVICLLLIAALAMSVGTLNAKSPTRTKSKNATSQKALMESANGWTYVKGEWVHPEGYKFVDGRVLRTTAKSDGRPLPKPPGKLALENPQKVTPQTNAVPADHAPSNTKTAADKAAEREKNLTPRPAPQTGTHM